MKVYYYHFENGSVLFRKTKINKNQMAKFEKLYGKFIKVIEKERKIT